MKIWLEGRALTVDPTKAIGKGGEADVYDLGDGRALKLFKGADHPDLQGFPDDQKIARARLLEHREKLRAFPSPLPDRLIAPLALATDKQGDAVLGYAMRLIDRAELLLRWSEPAFRQRGAGSNEAAGILRDLHGVLAATHRAGLVAGDFNDLNVLVRAGQCFLIDVDSFQFGRWPCRVFTERFLDPTLCAPGSAPLVPARAQNVDSDWYAFAVMVLQTLLCVGPYGGVHKPADPSKKLPPALRLLRRVTVLHPEVVYPKPAIPLRSLPDDLLHALHGIFVEDRRGPFPQQQLESLVFRRCTACGFEHARAVCPSCRPSAPAAIRESIVVRGTVTARDVVRAGGTLVEACVEAGILRWIVHENGRWLREDGSVALEGPLDPNVRVRLQGKRTLVARDGRLAVLGDADPKLLQVDDDGAGAAAFDASAGRLFRVTGGSLVREGVFGPERIGDVLAGRTRVFAGPRFGFGFYRAGSVSVAFVFEALRGGLRDGVRLPGLRGQLVGARCVFAEERAWLFLSLRTNGRALNTCTVIARDGRIEAFAEAPDADGSWLASTGQPCASGDFLIVPTDAGLVRVEVRAGGLEVTKTFPDTEPFVDAGSRVLPAPRGLYVVRRNDIRLLELA